MTADDLPTRDDHLGLPSHEHAWTLEVLLLCPERRQHRLGWIRTSAGLAWRPYLEDAEPSRTADPPRRHPAADDDPIDGSIFQHIDDASDDTDLSALPVSTATPPRVRRLAWDRDRTTGEVRGLRWSCARCAQNRTRRNRAGGIPTDDNVMRAQPLFALLAAMKNYGPAALRVPLTRTEIEALTARLAERESN